MRSMLISTSAAAVALLQAQVAAQTPLINVRYPWPYSGPAKVDSTSGDRGPQYGTNICNASTQGQNSTCVNAVVNDISDFCLWSPPEPNSVIGATEGEAVAWCTKSGYGTRLIPQGALTGVQAVQTPGYLVIAGYYDQTMLNIRAGDSGGELDPHGADQRGNPIGGLMYTKAFSGKYQQVVEWNSFVGSNMFCMKICVSETTGATSFCNNVYDTVGCELNMPLNYAAIRGSYTSCQGENQLPVGVYVRNGQTSTWPSPGENGAVNPPYTPFTPASSQCSTFQSAQLYSNTNLPPSSSIDSQASSMSMSMSTRSRATTSTTTLPPPMMTSTSTTTNVVIVTPTSPSRSATVTSASQPVSSITGAGHLVRAPAYGAAALIGAALAAYAF